MTLVKIPVERLQVGMYIHLDGTWGDHPFLRTSFEIKNIRQINVLLKQGVDVILFDPDRSNVEVAKIDLSAVENKPEEPILSESIIDQATTPGIVPVEAVHETLPPLPLVEDPEKKKIRVKKLKDRRVSLNRCEKAFSSSVSGVKSLMNDLRARPRESLEVAEGLVTDMVDIIMQDQDATMQLVNMKGQDECSYYHVVNVTMLSLLIGRELDLDDKQMKYLGIGAMLHDFGHLKVPHKILRKTSTLTDVEQKVHELHPRYGAELARKIGRLPKPVIEIMEQHHEMVDGSGYPRGLKGEEISQLSRIVAMVNAYDDACNSVRVAQMLTPYEAVAQMYGEGKFDKDILSVFINRLGVYPPGTMVQLSDNRIAGVTAVNHNDLLKPLIMIYNPDIPKEEAEIIDLFEETDLKIEDCLRRKDVDGEVMDYLNFGDSINYFVDTSRQQSAN